jgi:hypothetical protein
VVLKAPTGRIVLIICLS